MAGVIRPYRSADIIAVSEIYQLARPFEFSAEAELPLFQFLALTRVPHDMRIFEQCRIVVYEEDDQIKGFAGYMYDYIIWMYVHPDWHGQKIASRLLTYLIAEMPVKTLRISLVKSNQIAKRCYESFGFREIDTFGFDYQGTQVQAIRMERPSNTEHEHPPGGYETTSIATCIAPGPAQSAVASLG